MFEFDFDDLGEEVLKNRHEDRWRQAIEGNGKLEGGLKSLRKQRFKPRIAAREGRRSIV